MLSADQKNKLQWIIKKPHVSSACIGCSVCSAISGEVFTLDDDGLSTVLPLDNYEWHDVDDSIIACPVAAISWQEADATTGEYINGLKEHDNI